MIMNRLSAVTVERLHTHGNATNEVAQMRTK